MEKWNLYYKKKNIVNWISFEDICKEKISLFGICI